MRIPNGAHAIVEIRKLRDYCLNPDNPRGSNKARVFAAALGRLGGKPGLKKNPVLPTVIIKDQDLRPLLDWQTQRGVSIHVWYAFFDLAFGLALDEAVRLIEEGLIEPRAQVFQATGGQTTTKTTYNIYYHYAYELGESREQPELIAAHIIDKNGHIMPYVKFDGGSMTLSETALEVLHAAAERRNNEGKQ